ncbi:heterodisulfide reductase-related iron-sulfur binding cluster [Desulfosporosinus sp. Sb-LF]|uniref:heterodisulfide reductase-related iron-sulfur binding cluster n=1 Tax=Desulfosporosinus sp. Sb-LF TaxID=2560027 RepID=UPI00107F7099|nr:heterodisulfide reductase-related iron-sulfur binding cluster [Desulfosporosinus sp. Sb-LF]TGE33542.1 4Fe-4S dicluster domain-containing protein [Desulfosporosinus sp. Sb-LF]
MVATRQVYWNIEGHHWLYIFFALALLSFGYGIYRRVRLWKMGQPENRWSEAWQGIKDILIYTLGQKRVLKEGYAGIMHLAIFVGFIFLAFATAMITLQSDLGWNIFQGTLYLFIKVTANLFGLAAIVGILMAAYRRYILRPEAMNNRADDAITLVLIFTILVTGFVIQGVRMAVLVDPWSAWSIAGSWLATPLKIWFSQGQLLALHRWLWWFHLLLAMVFIGYLPYSKMFHILLAPFNQFFRKRGPIGVPTLIDFMDESIENYGVSSLKEFSWKALFNTDACLRCGRCQDNCPAYLSGKHLNPKQAIQEIKGLMEEEGRALDQLKREEKLAVGDGLAEVASAQDGEHSSLRSLVGEVIPEEDLWACTTCRSCEQQCPVFVEHVDKTIDMRRHLVLMESRFPAEVQLAFRNMENNGNPWGIGWTTRANFLTGIGVPTLEENPEAEILYWPGCSGAFDARNQKVATAVVALLRAAGINFAILGNEEKCCGDSARRLGNEFLFQTLASENIEVMKEYGVKKILTQCPHCFNILKNEYPQLGSDFKVVHHTTYFKELAVEGRLKLGKTDAKSVAFHDSCYLGRYNNIYDEPRELLKLVGLNVTEMKNHREKSFCCGAGGGRFWMEEHEGERINVMRTDEAIATGAELVGAACPFCLTMINDGINAREASDKTRVLDVAEILVQAL